MKKLLLTLGIAALALPTLNAQVNGTCGTSTADLHAITARLLENRERLQTLNAEVRNSVVYVPITFHLVAKDDGSERLPERRVLECLCGINEHYADQNIQFYIKRFNYINKTSLYNGPSSSGSGPQLKTNKKTDSMNIFVSNTADDGDNSNGITLAYYQEYYNGNPYSADWIVCGKGDVLYSKASTLAHEIGHFFTLLHTFNGWDHSDSPAAGTQVGVNAPEPGPNGQAIKNEYQNGSNCANAGDYVCDTPPDYNFGFGWNGCNYNGGVKDPTGMVVDPDETNMMGYFLECTDPQGIFSQGQKNLMYADLTQNPGRNYVNPGITPSTTDVVGDVVQLYPINSQEVAYNQIWFDWEDIPGATQYVIEISTSSSFTFGNQSYSFIGSFAYITNTFQANKTYYWRVFPFSDYKTCWDIDNGNVNSPVGIFKTNATVSAADLKPNDNWSVAPNPVRSNESLNISMDSPVQFEGEVKLFSITGQQMRHFGTRTFEAGPSTQTLETGNMANGTYILSIQTAAGVFNRRVVVAD